MIPPHDASAQNTLIKADRAQGRQFAETGQMRLRTSDKAKLPLTIARVGPSQEDQAVTLIQFKSSPTVSFRTGFPFG